MCTNTLPMRELLAKRHMIDYDARPWCNAEVESASHAIFDCPRVRDLWVECGCTSMTNWKDADSMCDLVTSWGKLDSKTKQKGVFLAWCIWGERNRKVFENKSTPDSVLVGRVMRYVDEQGKYANSIYRGLPTRAKTSPKTWQPPPPYFIKLNVDAAISEDGLVGLRVIARNQQGNVLFSTTSRVRASWSVEVAEAKAIALAARLGKRYGLRNVILETDCLTITNRLDRDAFFLSKLDTVLGDILHFCCSFNIVRWSHVKRDDNFVAHHLARVFTSEANHVWDCPFPPEVTPYVLMDKLTLI
ncbi:uncharacterized protein LOC110699080 [Chenopodium quinoa]|uniref:uncharacterized protein LOC110699080 n=1 Tax=Chenopodium quinoa TaxID=63459 RepID=UPI000B795750|nr:uncharacterized protein LOC110699080 [Chenopodium quinoa]